MAEPESIPNQGQAPSPATDSTAQPATPTTPAVSDDLKKIIQASEDRVRTHYSQELKKQQAIIDELRTKTMSESELRKMRESQLSEREAALQRKELELHSVDLLKDLNISPSLRELIIGKDADETKARAETLKTEFQKAVEAAVQERFKAAGRDPAKASDPPSGKRSYTRAEVDALSKQVMLPTTSQKDRESIMAELQAAAREGRIK
jgi:hypothetical protein